MTYCGHMLTRMSGVQFVDDDWLAANDLLPPTPPPTNPPSPILKSTKHRDSISTSVDKSPFKDATIHTLRLKPITTILTTTFCADAIETMRDKGFDQLPVIAASSSKKRLVGLVTLGNLLSWISQGRATPSSPVKDIMFSFSKISEVITDPRDLGSIPSTAPATKHTHGEELTNGEGNGITQGSPPRRQFVEITMDTPLRTLSRFFEWNSAAVVTERADEEGWMKPVAVVTKVDLLGWLVRQGKMNGHE